jgi:hypothetical protein
MAKKETPTQTAPVCWNCRQPAMKQLPNAKPGWMKCTVCGTTDFFGTKGVT